MKEIIMSYPIIIVVVLVVAYLFSIVKVVREYERAVIFRLGRVLPKAKGPGLFIVIWPIDKLVKVDLRIVTMDVPPQEIITRDNVTVKVNAVAYFRVLDPLKAIVSVENFYQATWQLAQTTLRSVLGEVTLDELLSEREKLNSKLQQIIDKHTDPWGIKVTMVEVKQVDLPSTMQRAMAKQAEAEREKRAKIIHAEGEFQAAEQLVRAAQSMSRSPIALQLRYLQTLIDIGAENNTTVVFPIPLDMFKAFSENKDIS